MLRPHSAFVVDEPAAYAKRANDRTTVMVMVETRQMIDNLDDILSVAGLDVAFVGPSDLSMTLGVTAGPESPEMLAVYERVAQAAARHGVALGAQVYSASLARRFIDLGVRYLSVTSDVQLIVDGLRERLAALPWST